MEGISLAAQVLGSQTSKNSEPSSLQAEERIKTIAFAEFWRSFCGSHTVHVESSLVELSSTDGTSPFKLLQVTGTFCKASSEPLKCDLGEA